MSKKQDHKDKTGSLPLDRLMLLERFKRESGKLNQLLQDFDLHGVATEAEQVEFWERYAVEAAGLLQMFGQISRLQGGGGRDRILAFLLRHVGEVVDGVALHAVSGVSEYGRRTRELREQGWRISTHENDSLLKPGQYRLESPEKDLEVASAYEEKQTRKKRGEKPSGPNLRLV